MTDSVFALETLLLFQSISVHGTSSQSFARISDALKTSELLRRDKLSDDRFDPRQLTEKYLKHLKAEAKAVSLQTNGTSNAPSPKLENIEDASSHVHLIPGIIPKLYETYKREVIREIRQDEQAYDKRVKVLAEEKGRTQATAKEPTPPHTVQQPLTRPPSNDIGKIDSILNEPLPDGEANHPQYSPEAAQRSISIGAPTTSSRSSSTPTLAQQSLPSTRPPYAPSPKLAQQPTLSARPSGSPVLLPPPQTGSRPPPPPPQWPHQPGPTPSRYSQSSQSPMPQAHPADPHRGLVGSQPGPQAAPTPQWLMHSPYRAAPPNRQQAYPQYATMAHQSLHSHSNSQLQSQSQPQPQSQSQTPVLSRRVSHAGGGIQLPPFSINSQQPPLQPNQPRPLQSSRQSLGPLETKNIQAAQRPTPQEIRARGVTSVQGTPVSAYASPSITNLQRQPGVHFSPGSSTGWRGPVLQERTRPRSISPVSDREKSPPKTMARGTGRRQKAAAAPIAMGGASGKPKRRLSKTPSVAATSSITRTRSQSVASFVDDASITSTAGFARGFKSDVNTPTPTDRIPARRGRPPKSLAIKRKRESSVPDTPVDASTPATPNFAQRSNIPPDTIIASRNFHRMTAPLMDHIASHKHASIFANPVPAKMKGYFGIIHRPTDLKTIRGQIAAGTRAVAAAAAASESGSPGGASTSAAEASASIALPFSEELQPPRAIVNAAQLGQELMRMFANAVMFNEGDEGVVADTREMFADVERSIAHWRSAEVGGVDEAGEREPDGGGGSAIKRRRL